MHVLADSAQHWYTNGTVIGVAGLAAGIVAVIVAIVLWRFGAPRGLLEYSMPVSKALIRRSPRLSSDDLQVTVRGKVAQDPYVVTVCIVNSGHRDIRSADFDRDIPLKISLGVPILDVLPSPDQDDKLFEYEGAEELHLPPTLIRRNRRITVNLLTEGRPTLECRESLADVRVRRQRRPENVPRWAGYMAYAGLAAFALGLVVSFSTAKSDKNGGFSINIIGFVLVLLGIVSVIPLYAFAARSFVRLRIRESPAGDFQGKGV
jgi:hypothetical protein